MIYIQKKPEPNLLLEYRHQINARFDDMDSDVKIQLGQENGLERVSETAASV